MLCDVTPTLSVLFVGSPMKDVARYEEHLSLRADQLRFRFETGGVDEVLALAARERVSALLVGPIAELAELPVSLLSRLVERDDPPVFLVLGSAAWRTVDWSSLPVAGVDGVLEWEACRGARLLDMLRYNIARARHVAHVRAASARAETMTAAVARMAAARRRAALCTVAVEAALALRASGCGVLLPEGDDLVLVQASGLDDQEARALARCTIDVSEHPAAVAARTRVGTWDREPDHALRAALPLLVDDELVGVLWVQLRADDSEVCKALETFAAHLADALGHAREGLRLSERALYAERLVAIAAHDLRSPLQVIAMGAGLLRLEGAVAQPRRFVVERIHESCARASALVNELSTVARTKGGQSDETLTTTSAFTILQACVSDFRVRMPDCAIALSTQGSGEAAVDGGYLTQVLHNLLANAAHYREQGSTVEVRGIGARARVYIEVNNRGPAIDNERMAELFAPMKRGAQGGEPGSVGLGLYIVKSLVESCGGSVWARSSAEAGTTFVVALPKTPGVRTSALEGESIAPYRVQPAEIPPMYCALLAQLPEGPLSKLLSAWLELGGAARLPHPRQLERTRLLAYLPDMFWVDVLGAHSPELQFRLLEVGGMLERRLDGHAPDEVLHLGSGAPLRPSMRAAYERCASTRRPTFDYVRSRGGDGATASFLRLVLPFSRDGEHVTQLIGMALFRNFDEASHAPLDQPFVAVSSAAPPFPTATFQAETP